MASKRPVLKIQYDSPVILTFALLCLCALVANALTDGWANSNLFSVYRFYPCVFSINYVSLYGIPEKKTISKKFVDKCNFADPHIFPG